MRPDGPSRIDLPPHSDPLRFAVTIAPPDSYRARESFREVAETVNNALLRLGISSVLVDDLRVPNRRHIVFGSNTLTWWDMEIPDDAILYNLEQVVPEKGWIQGEVLELFRRHTVWDYSLHNVEKLRSLGVERVHHVPIGSTPELERITAAEEPDIDVLFIGSTNPRRFWIIEQLQQAGVDARVFTNKWAKHRDALLARAKIVLNMHYDTRIFEIVRVSYLLTNGLFVVSETCDNPEETAEFADSVAFADYDDLVETCLKYLADPEAREARAETGRAIMRARSAVDYLGTALAESVL